jgi:hypothetical protein
MAARLRAEMTIPACAPRVIFSQRGTAEAVVEAEWEALVVELALVEVSIEEV